MDTLIIGVSGKKQSGKTTLCDYLFNNAIPLLLPCQFTRPIVNLYSFADALKKNVCIDVLGLTHPQCYETDEDKNTLTQYKWDNLPDKIRYDNAINTEKVRVAGTTDDYKEIPIPRVGPMKAREIMQVVGTDIFRNFFANDIWVNATFRQIEKDNPVVALISDVRFPGEVEGVVNKGGIVIRLLRDVCEQDPHPSETALDDYDFSPHGDSVLFLDNQNMSIEEQNKEGENLVISKMTQLGMR